MELLTVSEARKNLYKLVDNVASSHAPKFIKGKRNSAVLLSKEDWDSCKKLYIYYQSQGWENLLLRPIKKL